MLRCEDEIADCGGGKESGEGEDVGDCVYVFVNRNMDTGEDA